MAWGHGQAGGRHCWPLLFEQTDAFCCWSQPIPPVACGPAPACSDGAPLASLFCSKPLFCCSLPVSVLTGHGYQGSQQLMGTWLSGEELCAAGPRRLGEGVAPTHTHQSTLTGRLIKRCQKDSSRGLLMLPHLASDVGYFVLPSAPWKQRSPKKL